MSEANERGLPDDLEERVLDILDGPSEVRDAGLRALAAANPPHAPAILGWLRTAEATAAEPAPGDMFGDLRIAGLLGRGGMGVVYRAHDDQLARDVAVKVLPGAVAHEPGRVARFLREARIAAQLRHPNIVAIHRVAEQAGRPFMAMELVAGISLDRALANLRAGTVSVDAVDGAAWARAIVAAEPDREPPALASSHAEVVARLATAIAEALAHAHGQGVVHRDLKPANIMVRFDGAPVLLDFGLARAATGTRLTVEGQVMGTPEYFAPEQLSHDGGEPDARTDVWAFGVMLYQMLTLALPFGAFGPQLVARIQNADPLALRRRGVLVPRDLETICFTCLEKDPARRYPSAVELLADLRAFLEFRPVQARPIGRVGRAWRWARRNRMAATGAVLAGLAAIGTPSGIAVVQAAARHEVEIEKAAKDLANTELQATNEKLARETLDKEAALTAARRRAADASMQLGQRLLQRGQWQAALDAFDEAERHGHADAFTLSLGRFEAFEGLSDLGEARDLLLELDALELAPPQRARIDLLVGERFANRMLAPEQGLDVVQRALASGHLSATDAVYARGLLAPTLVEARRLFDEVLELEPGHRSAAIQQLPLVIFTGDLADLTALAVRLRALFPDDPMGPSAEAILALLKRDRAMLDRACAAAERAGLGKHMELFRAIGEVAFQGSGPDTNSVGLYISTEDAAKLVARAALALSGAGSTLSIHPAFARLMRATLPVLPSILRQEVPSEAVLSAVEAIWPDGIWELLRAHRPGLDFAASIAALRRAKEKGSCLERLIDDPLWDWVLTGLRTSSLADYQDGLSRRGSPQVDPVHASAMVALQRDFADLGNRRESDGLADVKAALFLRQHELAVELALRLQRRRGVELHDDSACWVARALMERGAYLWARQLLAELATRSDDERITKDLRQCDEALRKLGVTLPSTGR